MKKVLIILLVTVLAESRPISSLAMFMTDYCSNAVVTADVAPIRSDYPDGRILGVIKKGFKIVGRDPGVVSVVGDGSGTWLEFHQDIDGKRIDGFVDANMLSIPIRGKNGHAIQPKNENGSKICVE